MPRPNPKNFALSPAATDLGIGLGNMAYEQLTNTEEERRKKLLRLGNYGYGAGTDLLGQGAS